MSFLRSIKFPQQNVNRSEIRNGDKKLSVEMYVYKFLQKFLPSIMNIFKLNETIPYIISENEKNYEAYFFKK